MSPQTDQVANSSQVNTFGNNDHSKTSHEGKIVFCLEYRLFFVYFFKSLGHISFPLTKVFVIYHLDILSFPITFYVIPSHV
jgi:hypothetical protein